MERKAEKILRKIHIKDYTNSLEKVLEEKNFSVDTKNLLLSMVYKIENSYRDYEKTKVEVNEKSEFLERIINIIKEECNEIITTNNNEDFRVDKDNGKILTVGNELLLLKAILKMGEQNIVLTEEENILEPSISYFFNIANLMNELETIRDFNGWSWDISNKDIENTEINIAFQSLIYLLGYDFIAKWINNTSKLADYLMLANEKLKENFGEKRANELIKILCKIAIEECSKQDKNELKKWQELKKNVKIEYEKLNNKTQYLEEITQKKKKITKEIEKIDILINNQDLLKEEYEKRNSKLPNKKKIFSTRQLANKLEAERQEKINEIKRCNNLLEPKGYVQRKDIISKQYEFLNSLNLNSNKEARQNICELCILFLECFKIKITKAPIKQEIVKYIYELRYYMFLMFNENTSLKEIEELKKEFENTIEILYEKAMGLNVIERVTKDEEINYQIIRKIFDNKMIDLNNMVIETKVKDGKLFIEYYDTNILETRIEFHSDRTVKLNRKTKLFI